MIVLAPLFTGGAGRTASVTESVTTHKLNLLRFISGNPFYPVFPEFPWLWGFSCLVPP